MSTVIILMNAQSRGSVTLASANPKDAPLIDFNYMDHPYDRQTLIRGIRRTMQLTKTREMSKYWKGPINVPNSETDEDIWVCECLFPPND
jgi:choline dehydrogenase-like flavoprotein